MTRSRRTFLIEASHAAGALILAPVLTRCGSSQPSPSVEGGELTGVGSAPEAGGGGIPALRPAAWDPIAYNRTRGNGGAIPESYLGDINGPDGDAKHLGKHLPYIPASLAAPVPPGYVPLMWGDPSKGYAKHPNAAPTEEKPEGHWYDWVRLRKAVTGPAEETESVYSGWPVVGANDSGRLAAESEDDPALDGGRNTVYLAALPADVVSGDWVRVHAHCKTHGEYDDFIQVP